MQQSCWNLWLFLDCVYTHTHTCLYAYVYINIYVYILYFMYFDTILDVGKRWKNMKNTCLHLKMTLQFILFSWQEVSLGGPSRFSMCNKNFSRRGSNSLLQLLSYLSTSVCLLTLIHLGEICEEVRDTQSRRKIGVRAQHLSV